MGIYDREYYRREGPSILDSLVPSGQVCKWLILINIAAYVVQIITLRGMQLGPFTDALVLNVDGVLAGQVWRLITYAFLHSPQSLWHIFFNLLFLWWFGSELERMYGSREFLAFYLVSALVGGLVYFGLNWLRDDGSVCLGASGAVTALLVLFAFHFPNHVIYLFMLIPVPIWLFVIFQVAQDSFSLMGQIAGHVHTEVAVAVHLGGALFAALYYKLHWRLLEFWPWLRTWRRRQARPRLRLFREDTPEPVAVAFHPAPAEVDEHLEAKVDAVLEKVARFGQGSLTEPERQILLRASEIYKKRRS